jgi:hypothetical protein
VEEAEDGTENDVVVLLASDGTGVVAVRDGSWKC